MTKGEAKINREYEQLVLDFADTHVRTKLLLRAQLSELLEHATKTISLCHQLRTTIPASRSNDELKESLLIRATRITRVRDAEKQAHERLLGRASIDVLSRSYLTLHKILNDALPLLDRARKRL